MFDMAEMGFGEFEVLLLFHRFLVEHFQRPRNIGAACYSPRIHRDLRLNERCVLGIFTEPRAKRLYRSASFNVAFRQGEYVREGCAVAAHG